LTKLAKITLEGRKNSLAARAGKAAAPDEKLKSDIKVAYLSIGKGVQETQALMKAVHRQADRGRAREDLRLGDRPR
jgi:hypothetical protein